MLGTSPKSAPSALDRFCSVALDTVTIAGSYHAGKFLRPHGAVGSIGQALCRRFGGEGTALPVDSGLTASNIGMARELMLEDV
jgi:hypothetical protein